MKFCIRCGKQLEDNEICTCEQEQGKPAPRSKAASRFQFMPVMIVLFVTALILLILNLFLGLGAGPDAPDATKSPNHSNNSDLPNFFEDPHKIDLSNYIVIERVDGLNGQGTLIYHFDEDSLWLDMFGQPADGELTEEIMAEQLQHLTQFSNALACITLRADPETGLSNGDKVTVTAEFENQNNYEFDYIFRTGSKSFVVSDLKDGVMVDPFSDEYIRLTFSGFSGTGVASYEVLSNEAPASFFRYTLTPIYGLCNGDTVTLSVAADIAALEALGYFVPEIMEKEYTVSGLSEYYDMTDAFPEAELAALCQEALAYSVAEEEEDIGSGFAILQPSAIEGAFFLKSSDPSNPHFDGWHGFSMDNAVAIVTTYTWEYMSTEQEVWMVWIFPNYSYDLNGALVYEANKECSFGFSNESLESVAAWLAKEYFVMQITELPLP